MRISSTKGSLKFHLNNHWWSWSSGMNGGYRWIGSVSLPKEFIICQRWKTTLETPVWAMESDDFDWPLVTFHSSPLSSWGTLGKLFHLLKPQFPHLKSGDSFSLHTSQWCGRIQTKDWAQCLALPSTQSLHRSYYLCHFQQLQRPQIWGTLQVVGWSLTIKTRRICATPWWAKGRDDLSVVLSYSSFLLFTCDDDSKPLWWVLASVS